MYGIMDKSCELSELNDEATVFMGYQLCSADDATS